MMNSEWIRNEYFLLLDCIEEHLGGLESRDVVLGDDHRGVLGDIAGSLLSALLEDEATEAAEINVVIGGQSALYLIHECLYNGEGGCLVDASLLGDEAYDVLFCHFNR